MMLNWRLVQGTIFSSVLIHTGLKINLSVRVSQYAVFLNLCEQDDIDGQKVRYPVVIFGFLLKHVITCSHIIITIIALGSLFRDRLIHHNK